MRAGKRASISSRRRRASTGAAAAGADGDHYLAAIDDGRKDEGRQVGPVDHVDRNALAACALGNPLTQLALLGGNYGNQYSLKSALSGSPMLISRRPAPGRVRISSATSALRQYQRTCAPAGAPRARLGERPVPGPEQDYHASGDIHEQRQEAHERSRKGLTSIFFYTITDLVP